MQQLKTAVAVFCTACICAELVGQLLGDVRGRQCIKAAAGLYILVALFHALPGIRAGAAGFALPTVEAENFGTAGDAILRQAERELDGALEEQILGQTGLAAELAVTLEQCEEGTGAAGVALDCLPPGRFGAAGVDVRLPAGAEASGREAVQSLLCEALGIGPEAIVWTEAEQGG